MKKAARKLSLWKVQALGDWSRHSHAVTLTRGDETKPINLRFVKLKTFFRTKASSVHFAGAWQKYVRLCDINFNIVTLRQLVYASLSKQSAGWTQTQLLVSGSKGA